MALTDEEREHIRLAEEYRAEVRAKLAAPAGGDSLFDKLAVPVIIIVATALVSGLLVPWILGRVEDERRAFDLQSRLIEKIVTDDAEAQNDIRKYRGRVSESKIDLLEIDLEKRLLALRPLDAAERESRRHELADDFARIRNTYGAAHLAALDAMDKHAADEYRTVEWIKLHYDTAPVGAYQEASFEDRVNAGRATTKFEKEVTAIYRTASARLRTCPDETACVAIYDEARAKIEGYGFGERSYEAWNRTRRELTTFISTTKPRL